MATITKTLVCVDSADRKAGGSGSDHNKYYKASFDGSTIYYEYGRIGATCTKGQKAGTRASYDKLINSKLKKGYIEVDTHEGKDMGQSANKDERVAKAIAQDPEVEAFVKKLVEANTHDLFDGKYKLEMTASGAVKTDIGVLTSNTITKAEGLLKRIMKGEHTLIKEYFTYIPHYVRIGQPLASVVTDWEHEKELFDVLKQHVADYEKNLENEKDVAIDDEAFKGLFKLKLRAATTDELNSIKRMFDETKQDRHHRASQKQVKAALAIEYNDEEEAHYTTVQNKIGNVKQLWHGTTAQNVLNILRTGLFCPKSNDSRYGITGRMFGDGVYLSDQSTKALNYACGFWGHASKGNATYMFLADTAMGNEYRPANDIARHQIPSNARKGGYDSIYIKGGTQGVINNEMIVWNTEQIRLSYLVIFE